MAQSYCPGQNRRFWTPDDIHTVQCPSCGGSVELFKDEGKRKCPNCGQVINNPKVLEGCAAWCAFAEACTGINIEDSAGAAGKLSTTLIELLVEYGNCSSVETASLQEAEKLAEDRGINAVYPQGAIKIAFILHVFMGFVKNGKDTKMAEDLVEKLQKIIPGHMIKNVQEVVHSFTEKWPGGESGPKPELSQAVESLVPNP